jgi:hypothetical protein
MPFPAMEIAKTFTLLQNLGIYTPLKMRKYLDTWAMPWTVRITMTKITPKSAANGVKRVRREEISKPAPRICFAPNIPAKYPLGIRVSIIP